jgi:hypothetical protein
MTLPDHRLLLCQACGNTFPYLGRSRPCHYCTPQCQTEAARRRQALRQDLATPAGTRTIGVSGTPWASPPSLHRLTSPPAPVIRERGRQAPGHDGPINPDLRAARHHAAVLAEQLGWSRKLQANVERGLAMVLTGRSQGDVD